MGGLIGRRVGIGVVGHKGEGVGGVENGGCEGGGGQRGGMGRVMERRVGLVGAYHRLGRGG